MPTFMKSNPRNRWSRAFCFRLTPAGSWNPATIRKLRKICPTRQLMTWFLSVRRFGGIRPRRRFWNYWKLTTSKTGKLFPFPRRAAISAAILTILRPRPKMQRFCRVRHSTICQKNMTMPSTTKLLTGWISCNCGKIQKTAVRLLRSAVFLCTADGSEMSGQSQIQNQPDSREHNADDIPLTVTMKDVGAQFAALQEICTVGNIIEQSFQTQCSHSKSQKYG